MEATLADRLTSTVGGGRRAGREGAEGGTVSRVSGGVVGVTMGLLCRGMCQL